jgi:PKD repeat protein
MTKSRWSKSVTLILLGVLFVAGVGVFAAPRLHAALFTYIYPTDKNILINRSFEPDDFSAVSSGGAITVTIDVTNNESVPLRGFYYSDQVPDVWVVNTASVSVNGSSIADYTYGQGYTGEVYTDSIPHRWALEMPQGDGVFSPAHSIPASGGTARIVYTMIVSGGTGSDYSIGYDAWAGWLETTPNGTAIFGYETIPSAPTADFTASPLLGLAPLTVTFTDLSEGDVLTRTWDFGDGDTILLTGEVSGPGPTHTYSITGCYSVSLTVQNAYESAPPRVQSEYIHVVDVIYNVYLPVILRNQ